MRLVFTFLLLTFPGFNARAQELLLGRVLDAETREPVVGVHVIAFGKKISGNTSNISGEFILTNPGSIDSIRISCIGYKTFTQKGFSKSPIVITLQPHITSLAALTVKPPSATELIRNAVDAIHKNYVNHPFQVRGFYREQIRNDSVYYSVAEAVFESQLTPGASDDDRCKMKLVQGRRSETVRSTRMFEDYHPGGGPNYLMGQGLEVNVPEFMQAKNFKEYDFTIDSITSYEGMDVYVIGFDQKSTVKKNLWKGTIFIEAESLAVISLDYALSDKGIEYRNHLTGKDKVMANLLGIDFDVLKRKTHLSYHKSGDRWNMHEANLTMNIHFVQPRKDIDERFTLKAEMLALSQNNDQLTPFAKSELWHSNNLVKSLPGEFDDRFWGADNYIQPEQSVVAAVAAMKVIQGDALTANLPDGWQLLHPEMAKIYKNDSTLMLKPYVESRWKDAERGPFLWKTVTGNFQVEANLVVTKASDPESSPNAGFQIGGIMLRWDSDTENHIYAAIGCMGNPAIKMICQNTINGNSAIHVTKIPRHQLRVRISRTGNVFQLQYYDQETKQWTLWRELKRENIPAALQLGIAGYAHVPGNAPNRKPDVLVQARHFTIIPSGK